MFDPASRSLFVDEHLGRAVWHFEIGADWRVTAAEKILDSKQLLAAANNGCVDNVLSWPNYAGPDGIRLHPSGAKFIALYGLGGVLVLDSNGSAHCVPVPFQYPTSMAFGSGKIAITGTNDLFAKPLTGTVMITKIDTFLPK